MEHSEFRITNASVRFGKETTASKFGCLGSIEESMETKQITKKCEGVVIKNRVRPTGGGELKVTMHIMREAFLQAFGMNDNEELIEGVRGYGKFPHEPFVFTADVYDEDDVKKLKAYPNCIIKDGISRKIENGGDEVAEIELTITTAADEFGYGMYEALDTEITDETVKTEWHTKFTPELVRKKTATRTVGK